VTRNKPRRMGPPRWSERLYVELEPSRMALFRFLLEAWDNLAYFTVLDRRRAVVRLVFSPDCTAGVEQALAAMAQAMPLRVIRPPLRLDHTSTPGKS